MDRAGKERNIIDWWILSVRRKWAQSTDELLYILLIEIEMERHLLLLLHCESRQGNGSLKGSVGQHAKFNNNPCLCRGTSETLVITL
jgi:hypothetical protein